MLLNINHPFLAISHQLTTLCEPLETLGIHHFSYMKHWPDGKRFNLSNRPQWIEDYYNLNLYQSSLFEHAQEVYKPGFDMWFGDYDIEVYRHGRDYYNTSHTIVITEVNHQCVERYFFATTPDNPEAIRSLGNNVDVLYHFIAYLNDRAYKLFSQADKHKVQLQSKKHSPVVPQDKIEKLIKSFYKKTHVYKYYLHNKHNALVKLTDREIDCLAYLFDNYSANETAVLMGLSRRTVESYLDNARVKLNCENKLELFHLIKHNRYLRVLRG